MAMIRKQLYLSTEQQKKVRRIARQRGCTEAAVVRDAVDRLPEYDNPIARRLAEAGVLAPPPNDEDLLTEEEDEALERELDEWARSQGPLGLSELVREDREGR